MLSKLIPGLSTVKAVIAGALSVALLSGGVAFGVWARALGDGRRVAEAVKPLCDAAAAKARVKALEDAIAAEKAARRDRETEVATLAGELETLKRKQQEAANASQVRDRVCIPADDAWVQQGR